MTEIITLQEALARIGLEDLSAPWSSVWVEWTGYPRPFACGDTEEYGYGPERGDAEPDCRGLHRAYRGLHRVSRSTAGGPILYSWQRWSEPQDGKSPFRLRGGAVVSVVSLIDRKGTALRVGLTC